MAIAVGDLEEKSNKKDLIGIVALYDKPRSDSATLISELKKLDISIKMLTGDSLPIAREIARLRIQGYQYTVNIRRGRLKCLFQDG
ncbi:MAG: hypothetical protein WA667_10680 [Candidatus Nitrosopolaris sp.]